MTLLLVSGACPHLAALGLLALPISSCRVKPVKSLCLWGWGHRQPWRGPGLPPRANPTSLLFASEPELTLSLASLRPGGVGGQLSLGNRPQEPGLPGVRQEGWAG